MRGSLPGKPAETDILTIRRPRPADRAAVVDHLARTVRWTWLHNGFSESPGLNDEIESRIEKFDTWMQVRTAITDDDRVRSESPVKQPGASGEELAGRPANPGRSGPPQQTGVLYDYRLAELGGVLAGVGATYPAGGSIRRFLPGSPDWNRLPEFGSIYVADGYQRLGLGLEITASLTREALRRGFGEFVLDSGYVSSQRYWIRRLGEPTVRVESHWGSGFDYLIWKRELSQG